MCTRVFMINFVEPLSSEEEFLIYIVIFEATITIIDLYKLFKKPARSYGAYVSACHLLKADFV